MAPWIPRLHLWEIDDQSWFPPFLRRLVQDALTIVWTYYLPPLQWHSPAQYAALLLEEQFSSPQDTVFIDFCSGAGGPTPEIERLLNMRLENKAVFVMTDLHPHVASLQRAVAGREERLRYEAESVDATNAGQLVKRLSETLPRSSESGPDRRVCRLFNLAFHHFPDDLARKVLKDAVECGDTLVIFELQDRSIDSLITTLLLGFGIFIFAPYFAWKLRSPSVIIFTYLIPILPFVLVFDGLISGLRTRTSDELMALLRDCGANTTEYKLKSGRTTHLWPCGHLGWTLCEKDSG